MSNIAKITWKERQIIYRMWTAGATQKEIIDALQVAPNTLRTEMYKGFTGECYIGGRRIYDPELAERNSGPISRANRRKLLSEQEVSHNPPPQ